MQYPSHWLRLALIGLLIGIVPSFLAGCSEGGTDGDDDDSSQETTPTDDSPTPAEDTPSSSDVSIFTLNQNSPADNTIVTVDGVVTAITYKGDFWIQDSDGGLYSGIYVYDPNEKGTAAGIAIGDKLQVTGHFVIYNDLREISVYEEDTEGTVTLVTSSVGTPAPLELDTLDPLKTQDICAGSINNNIDPYIGVLLQFPETTVSAGMGACGTETFYGVWEVEDDGGIKHLVDDDTYSYDPIETNRVQVTGVLTYSYGQYKLNPTEIVDDFSGNLTPTPPPPATEITIISINQDPPEDNTIVTVEGVVTAITYKGDFWIQDSEGGLYSGIYVYDPNEKGSATGIAIGDTLQVTGRFTIYNDLREISVYEEETEGAVTLVTASVGTPAPLELDTLDPLEIEDVCAGGINSNIDPYIGVLLQFPETTVSAGMGACGTEPSYGIWEVEDDGGVKHLVDDDTYSYDPIETNRVQVTGVLTYSYGQYKLNPTEIVDDFSGNP